MISWGRSKRVGKIPHDNLGEPGKGFRTPHISWRNPSPWSGLNGNNIRDKNSYGTITDVFDIDGDGLPDRVVYDRDSPYNEWSVYLNKGPMTDLLVKVENGIGGTTEIAYTPSTAYTNTFLPFVAWTVSSQKQSDGRGNTYESAYEYENGFYDPVEVEFRGFQTVTVCQPKKK